MFNKPRSQRSSAAPEDGISGSNRRARRKEKQKDAEKDTNAEAGPSRSNADALPKPSSSSRTSDKTADGPPHAKHDRNRSATTAFGEDDFVPFVFPDDPTEGHLSERESSPPEREWDRGKAKGKGRGKERSRSRDRGREDGAGASRKRKAVEVSNDDGYANKKERVAAASRRSPWARLVNWEKCVNVAEMLHEEVRAFVDYMSPTPQEDELRSLTVAIIARAVKQHFPDAQVLPFGSYETKLYLPLGDIDLVIYADSMARYDKNALLHSLANIMKKNGITDRVTIIAKARVPIVKFVTRHGQFAVDISVNQGNGVTTGKMIKQFLQELPALRSLVLVIKNFLSQRSMNEVFTGGLGSYSIVCLAISFLQMHPKIRRGEIDPSRNLGVLVMEYFELYGSYFNYQEVGISLRDGGSYYNKRERGWFNVSEPRLLSIEDPGDPTNDISRGSYNFARVRTTFAGAHNIMTAAAFTKASIVSARREGRMFHLRPASSADSEETSILGSVIGVTQETINHRKVVQEVYDRQVLHRILGVTPKVRVTLTDAIKPSAKTNSRTAEAQSVESAWGEADMDVSSDSDSSSLSDEGEEEESRYEIKSRRPPKKRRRTGTRTNDAQPAVYTTDDDDEARSPELLVSYRRAGDADGVSDEEEVYNISNLDAEGKGGTRAEAANRRSYWLSKGMASAENENGDD
ncbi:uncharacterized protein BXZ73DRAFT_90121 [Epithele typhae]|uniref:uncharacterized protein n=1 Tax=Epithele typhae TaxID=378194 RepID=UPI002008AE70|nr:uncharacterized protein BXZ73DRAFT_90121 [Epithele typhae]KAH9931703.1 hypothetical protein BXZ73DRAFT_90121 [Epithele typhae]